MISRRQGVIGLLATLASAEGMSGQIALDTRKGPKPLSLTIDGEWYDSIEVTYKGKTVRVYLDEIMNVLKDGEKK